MNKKITSIVRQQPKLTGQIGNTLIYIDPDLEDQKVDIVKNGVYTLRANEGFDGLNSVEINAEIVSDNFATNKYTGTSTSYFNNLGSHVKDIPVLDLGDSTSAYHLCYYAKNLEHIGKVVANATINQASGMFMGCSKLKSIDSIDVVFRGTSTGTQTSRDCSSMFRGCEQLEGELKLNININGGNMDSMFNGCKKLKKIDISSITTTPQAFVEVFLDCFELEELDISGMSIPYTPNTHSGSFKNVGKNLSTPTKVYVKDEATQNWILSLSGTSRPSNWSTENVIIKG